MDKTVVPDLAETRRIESAVLRFAYARAFSIDVPDAPAGVDLSLLLLLRDQGLTDGDALRVIAADLTIAALPKQQIERWSAKSYNEDVWPGILTEFGQNAGAKVTWPPYYNKFSQSWSDALISAGLSPKRDSVPTMSKEEAKKHLRRFVESWQGSRNARDYVAWRKASPKDKLATTPPSLDMLNRLFGSWSQALDAAGVASPGVSASQREADNAEADLISDREGHRADAERLRERLRTEGGASPDLAAHHSEVVLLMALETHALASFRVTRHLLEEREESAKTFKRWAIAGAAALAFVPPVIEFLLTRYL
ncbi:hypothetical protein [Cryobacterium melibiosiphilum]|uniref:hypothetical protein n=1 Tax=Cryobacterium melibiosiphilum TaxID=995039 RepID=UPI001F29587A|nr:hypothetical protein [Cryobacterium melibiosiphilum]